MRRSLAKRGFCATAMSSKYDPWNDRLRSQQDYKPYGETDKTLPIREKPLNARPRLCLV
jgi:hypothetical protein